MCKNGADSLGGTAVLAGVGKIRIALVMWLAMEVVRNGLM